MLLFIGVDVWEHPTWGKVDAYQVDINEQACQMPTSNIHNGHKLGISMLSQGSKGLY